jgi:hypothetical protein
VHPSLNCIDFLCMDSDSSFTRANPRITLATKVYSPTQGFNLLQISPNWFLRNWTLDPLSKVGLQSSSKIWHTSHLYWLPLKELDDVSGQSEGWVSIRNCTKHMLGIKMGIKFDTCDYKSKNQLPSSDP